MAGKLYKKTKKPEPPKAEEKKGAMRRLWERFRGRKSQKNDDVSKGMTGMHKRAASMMSEDDAAELRKMMDKNKRKK